MVINQPATALAQYIDANWLLMNELNEVWRIIYPYI